MTPLGFLSTLLAITAAAVIIEKLRMRWRARKLRALAAACRMNYTPADSLQISTKVMENFPIPGAAALHVRDLVYGIEGNRYRYIFTAEYTLGVMRGHRRQVRVGTFCEPRSRYATEACSPVVLAAESGRWTEQYNELAPIRGDRAIGQGAPETPPAEAASI